jgi:hypothetical protein
MFLLFHAFDLTLTVVPELLRMRFTFNELGTVPIYAVQLVWETERELATASASPITAPTEARIHCPSA